MVALSLSTITYSEPYKRSLYGSGWIDTDKDCQDTRQEVLIAESLVPVTFKTEKQCEVATGLWVCPYTGKIITNPADIDIEHVVPLEEAHTSGASEWTREQRIEFANYLENPDHLMAVWRSANRSKGKRDPASWMPSSIPSWEWYLLRWQDIKQQWGLIIDDAEQAAIDMHMETYRDNHRGLRLTPSYNYIR